jgi:DNA-binding MarR family transcriptional regulator
MSENSLKDVSSYLDEVLGTRASFAPYKEAKKFPHVLQGNYVFHEAEIEGRRFLALVPSKEDPTPASLQKQLGWIEEKTGLRGVVVLPTLTAHERRRLIDRRIPFVVPGFQVYLPELGILLREQSHRPKRKVQHLSPAGQVLVLAACLGRISMSSTRMATALASRLGYTKMTFSRALDELRERQLVRDEGGRRAGLTQFRHFGRQLWEAAHPFLRSPIKRRVYLDDLPGGPALRSGEWALADRTALAAPARTTWAVGPAEWKELQARPHFRMLPEADRKSAGHEVEVWTYSPTRLSEGPSVDPLSLALSLADATDDRVQIAIDELVNRVW